MLNLIARSAHPKSRTFPALDSEFLRPTINSDLTPDQRVARKLLTLPEAVHHRSRRLSRRDPAARFARLMIHHQLAINAELEGNFHRADFLWSTLYPDLKSLLSDNTAWSGVVASVAGNEATTEMADAITSRSRLVCEILLDTHIGFYNGQSEVEALGNRAAAHLDYILALLNISGLSIREASELVTPAIYDRLRVSRNAGNWEQALAAGELLLTYAGGEHEYQSLLTDLWKSYALANPANLDAGIFRLERISDSQPPDLDVFQTLGHLYEAKADALARGFRVSAALVAIEKALAYQPHLQQSRETRDRLVEYMKKILIDAYAFRLRLSLEPDLGANAAGQQLLLEARQGFGPMKEFKESEPATRLSHGFTAAVASALWRDLGIGETSEDMTEKQLRLLKAVTNLSQVSEKTSAADREAEWKRTVSDAPALAGIDPLEATSVLRRLQSGKAEKAPTSPAFIPPTDPPLLTVVGRKRQVAAQPFRHWLLSRDSLRIKAQVGIAIALVVYFGTLGLHDRTIRRARDQAFAGVLQAADSNQPRTVIEFAEAFLSDPSSGWNDPRNRRVLTYYEHALAQWLLDANSEPNEELSSHLDRYRSLTSTMKRGGL